MASAAREPNPRPLVMMAVAWPSSSAAAQQGPDIVCCCLGMGALQRVEQKNPSPGHVGRAC